VPYNLIGSALLFKCGALYFNGGAENDEIKCFKAIKN